ncbi:alpha/beta fold hydrolase [Streptomyces boluensis]|uniref:Alpha/beta fold hydrolase n=1 Tax=Streptomyces boluensis TaxID=1775135 RepID=A0A964UT87_9ACTN|nr:alpha/beta fold hydrolase [Streptomyces boluensis]NBE52547.1 alpha/beta fold hydrolase [Streptomyces boluensis]
MGDDTTPRTADAAFRTAYDEVLRQWPVEVHGTDVPTTHGSTRVQICGRADATPLVLLPGGGATSVSWFANGGALAAGQRIYAPDLMGDFGRSVPGGAPLRGADDLTAWLDSLLDALGLEGARFCGHSYGAWIALKYALHAPHRVRRLALLDPTNCFGSMRPGYLAHALPSLLRPTAARVRAFHRWETGRDPEHPAWQAFLDSSATARRTKVVAMRRPEARDLRALDPPTLVLLAENSRAHDVRRVAAEARRLLPDARVDILPGASHHSLPTEQPAALNRELTEFLGRGD